MWVQQRNVQNGRARCRRTGSSLKITEAYDRLVTGVAIAEETVGDAATFLHKIVFFEIAHKYADILSLEELGSQL
jgi:hypothetical protein